MSAYHKTSRRVSLFAASMLLAVATLIPVTASAAPLDMLAFWNSLSPTTQATVVSMLPIGSSFATNPSTEEFALIPPATLSSILNFTPAASMPLLPSNAFSLFTSGNLTTMVNGLTPTILSSLQNTLKNVATPILKDVLSGMTSSLASSLPSDLFSGITNPVTGITVPLTVAELTSVLSGATTDVLTNLSSSVFSGLPSDTLSGLITGLPSSVLSGLGGDLLGGLSSTGLQNVLTSLTSTAGFSLSSLAPSLLSSILPSTFAGLTSTSLSGLLTGLSSSAITSLGGNLLSGLTSAGLEGALSAMPLASVSGLASSLFSGVTSSVLGGITGGLTGPLGSAISAIPGLGAIIPGLGGGYIPVPFGIFVPVSDMQLNANFIIYAGRFGAFAASFEGYKSNFNTYADNMRSILDTNTDSLKNIITGGDPGGAAKADCAVRDANDRAFAWANGTWAAASASSTTFGIPTPLPLTIPSAGGYVQVNDSGSIRCILQELIGYQKTSLYVQIQSLLKQYIADAQQKALSNKLLNEMSAINLKWGKSGNEVVSGGLTSSESVYVLDSTQSAYYEGERITDNIIAQTAAPIGDPIGPLEINRGWELFVATQVARNVRDETENERAYFADATRGTLTEADGPFAGEPDGAVAFQKFMNNANDPAGSGALVTLEMLLNNPQNTPIGAVSLVEGEARRRIEQQQVRRDKGEANEGFRPTKECSGLPSDPYCDPALMIDVSPSAQNREVITSALHTGYEQISNSDTLDTTSATSAELLSITANTQDGGVFGYNEEPLQYTETAVNMLIYELYDSVKYGYFDLDGQQEDWASAAFLNIYDTMYFNDEEPTVGSMIDDTSATYYEY